MLADEQTGKDLRGLVTHDRLKHYFRDQAAQVQRQTSAKACFKPVIKILSDRVVNGICEFLVLFKNKTRKWRQRSQIGDRLLSAYQQNRQQTKLYKNRKMLLCN